MIAILKTKVIIIVITIVEKDVKKGNHPNEQNITESIISHFIFPFVFAYHLFFRCCNIIQMPNRMGSELTFGAILFITALTLGNIKEETLGNLYFHESSHTAS